MFYLIVGLTLSIVVLIIYIKFYATRPVNVSDPGTEIADANAGIAAGESAIEAVKIVNDHINKISAELAAEEAEILANAEKNKKTIERAKLSEIKDFLKKEGFNVEEIHPE